MTYYKQLSDDVLKKDEVIHSYEETLNRRIIKINNIVLNRDLWDIITHPIVMCEASMERRKLKTIKDSYDKLKTLPLLRFVEEEQGSLDEDLLGAARTSKPKIIKDFIKKNDINNTKLDKKLVKIRK